MGDRRFAPARKSLGQHFLVDDSIIRRIVESAGIPPGGCVVEIGPGRGAITAGLAARAGRIVLVEKDDQLQEHWQKALPAHGTMIHRDALLVEADDLPPEPLVVVGNLPYYVAGRITMHVVERWPQARDLCFMYQLEVARRLVAGPGSSEYGALSIMVQSQMEAWLLFNVPPGAFRPAPKVNSAVVRLRRRPEPLVLGLDPVRFSAVVHGAFAVRRKTLPNALKLVPGAAWSHERILDALAAAGGGPTSRPQELGPEAWVRLVRALDA